MSLEFFGEDDFFLLVLFCILVGHFCGIVGLVDFHDGMSNIDVGETVFFEFLHNLIWVF